MSYQLSNNSLSSLSFYYYTPGKKLVYVGVLDKTKICKITDKAWVFDSQVNLIAFAYYLGGYYLTVCVFFPFKMKCFVVRLFS